MIANPPYVRMEEIKEFKAYFKQWYPQVYEGRADLFVYFYHKALDILHANGLLAFISSNKFMRARYGGGLRELLTERATFIILIDFGDLPIFKATTYPSVLIIRKCRPTEGHTFQALTIDDIAAVGHLTEVVHVQAWPQPQRSLRREGWSLERPKVLALLEKLRHSGTPLGEYVKGKFYRGIVTGLNKAFVIDQATRDRLIAEDPHSAEIIKPWLRGKDVKRWWVEWAELSIIFTYHGVDIERYPAIQTYLEQFREQLEQRATSAHHTWYELQQPQSGIYAEFEKPKIVWPDIAKQCEFGFDDQNLYPDCTLFIVPEADLYLLGILNSTVVEWFYRHVSPMIQQDFLRFKRAYLRQIPIPNAFPAQRAAIEPLVRNLLDAKGQGPQVAEWEQELNALVYKLYRLTNEEICIVEEEHL